MEDIFSSEEMRRLEQQYMERTGLQEEDLIERAAIGLCAVVLQWMSEHTKKGQHWRLGLLVGSGNNGADAVALARKMAKAGTDCEITLFSVTNPQRPVSPGQQTQWELLNRFCPTTAGVTKILRCHLSTEETYTDSEMLKQLEGFDLIVDGIFGIGLKRPVTGVVRQVIQCVEKTGCPVIAVDMPSGLDADIGQVLGAALPAQITVTFEHKKRGQVLDPGRSEYCGRLICHPIDLGEAKAGCHAAVAEDILAWLPKRKAHSHKGTYGHVLVIGGACGMAGAAMTAAMAAYRTGAGLATILSAPENRMIYQIGIPEAIYLDWTMKPEHWIGPKITAVVLGPGLGTDASSKKIFLQAVEQLRIQKEQGRTIPVVLDADALNLIAREGECEEGFRRLVGTFLPVILTPHKMELSRLLHEKLSEVSSDLGKAAATVAKQYGVICVAKDSATVIAADTGECFVNTTGCDAMATGGSGDALAGVIGSLLGQKTEPQKAAVAGVWIHGRAGEWAADTVGSRGTMARDIVEGIAKVLQQLDQKA